MKTAVYLDYQATTPVDRRVVEAMLPYFSEKFGNPASRQHQFGWAAEEAVERARSQIARAVGASPQEIIFTSGATESNNLALRGAAESLRAKGTHIVTVQTEHKSVLDTCKRLSKQGFSLTYLPVDGEGMLDPETLRAALTPKTTLVSVMLANNETGTLQPVAEIGRICRERKIVFHTDATQALGRIPLDVVPLYADLLSLSSHKIYGPKGVGALYVRKGEPRLRITPQIEGGGHERGLRSGTLNVPGIVGFGAAVELSLELMEEESARLARLRDRLREGLAASLEEVVLNGPAGRRLSNNLNLSFLHVDADALMMSMKDIAVSSGSACSTADPEPSHVLKAMHLPPERLHSAIRFSLGRYTTEQEIEYTISRVAESVKKLRTLSAAPRLSHVENEPGAHR